MEHIECKIWWLFSHRIPISWKNFLSNDQRKHAQYPAMKLEWDQSLKKITIQYQFIKPT